jgi:heterodisulfide reductase subunit A
MKIKTGFYICHCGVNIAGKVDVEKVAEFIGGLKDVTVARDYKFMCSDPGQDLIVKDIHDLGLNRVVVASCSPRLHGKTFQGACQRAGLNPYFFQMASVREQVSWVTEDPDEATDKAKSLAAAAVSRVNFHERLHPRQANVHPDIMVVGGGIAGIQAALDIAQSGLKAYLVERAPTIGGHMLQFDKTFPTLDCAACIGTPKMVEVAQNPNIKLFSYSEVQNVDGYIGNYSVTIHKKPRYVNENLCTGCGECAKVCPVSVPSEWDENLIDRQAVYRPFPQAVPITFCIDKLDRAPCTTTCPAGINVQGYVQLIGQGKYAQAVSLIMEKLPLPGVLGRVCPHPCESVCRRKDVDEAVSIRELKRFAADQVDLAELPRSEIKDRDEKVAIIGSGPAGLTAAYFLRQNGFQVTIFEASETLGGMLRLGIPDYRLPPDILDREIQNILSLGIEAKLNCAFGTDVTLESLKQDGFQAVFLGIGAHGEMKLSIPGEDESEAAIDAVGYLRNVNLGQNTNVAGRVLVIGGGNVALDAARCARRTGAEHVTIVYRRSADEMPAYPAEIRDAMEEGIEFLYLTAPVKVAMESGKTIGLECIQTELGAPDASGRRRPVPVEGSERVVPADWIISAIGQRVHAPWAKDEPDLQWTQRGFLAVNPETMQTSIPHVFAAGDSVTGPATVIEAVASGRQAAESIQRFLDGQEFETETGEQATTEFYENWQEIPPDMPKAARIQTSHETPETRLSGFTEVVHPLSPESAEQEAARCLNCGVCSECMECVKVCEAKAIDHSMVGEDITVKVGSIILATGFDLMDPSPMKQFGYGKYPNVFTSLEFERLNNATGPTGGKIMMRDENGEFTHPPESMAIVHCVGSRDDNYHEYCSRVCCMYALKYGHLIHDKIGPHAQVHDFYIDLRCFGKGYEEFFRRCQEEGIQFTRGKPAEIQAENDKLVVIGEDTLLGKRYRVPVDMVVLCSAIQAREDAADVCRIFGVNQGKDGFFLEEHPKLAPLSTASDGIFLAGTCQAPRDVPDTVAQASGAAAKALSLAVLGQVEIEPTISWIDPDVCAGCQICIGLCPYTAIEYDPLRGVSVVNEALCKGCGSCAGFCPSGAARVRHFNDQQIFAEIDGIMNTINMVGR